MRTLKQVAQSHWTLNTYLFCSFVHHLSEDSGLVQNATGSLDWQSLTRPTAEAHPDLKMDR